MSIIIIGRSFCFVADVSFLFFLFSFLPQNLGGRMADQWWLIYKCTSETWCSLLSGAANFGDLPKQLVAPKHRNFVAISDNFATWSRTSLERYRSAVGVACHLAVLICNVCAVHLRTNNKEIWWLGDVVVRASDLWSTGCEFDSRPCAAGLVLGWVTVCGRVDHLGMNHMNQSPRSTQPFVPPGWVNQVPACLAGVTAGCVHSLVSGGRCDPI